MSPFDKSALPGETVDLVGFIASIGIYAGSPSCIRTTMRHKQLSQQPKTFALIFDTGDEITETLKRFATEQKLAGSSFKAIGALSFVKLGWFNWKTKKYEVAVELDEQVELLSLIGDVALNDHEPQIHAHVVVGAPTVPPMAVIYYRPECVRLAN